MSQLRIGNRTVGSGQPVYLVAEIGGNHNGSLNTAMQLVKAAAEAGASAVKGQCLTPDAMTLDVDDLAHEVNWQGRLTTLHKLYTETAMPLEWHAPLKALADSLYIDYFASVFDQAGIDLMVSLGAPCLKIASFEVADLPLLSAAARTGLPLIISTGMATLSEITAAGNAGRWTPRGGIAFLVCTSAYPAPVGECNLNRIRDLMLDYQVPVGLSDHTRNDAVVSAAVALGACVVERHIRMPDTNGPDAAFSDTPEQFGAMVHAIRDVESALGSVHYGPTESERPMLRFRRSLWAVRDIAAGEVITTDNVRSLRPEGGLPPTELPKVAGRHAAVDIPRGAALIRDMVGL